MDTPSELTMLACQHVRLDLLSEAIQAGAQVDHVDRSGDSEAYACLASPNSSVLEWQRLLVEFKASPLDGGHGKDLFTAEIYRRGGHFLELLAGMRDYSVAGAEGGGNLRPSSPRRASDQGYRV